MASSRSCAQGACSIRGRPGLARAHATQGRTHRHVVQGSAGLCSMGSSGPRWPGICAQQPRQRWGAPGSLAACPAASCTRPGGSARPGGPSCRWRGPAACLRTCGMPEPPRWPATTPGHPVGGSTAGCRPQAWLSTAGQPAGQRLPVSMKSCSLSRLRWLNQKVRVWGFQVNMPYACGMPMPERPALCALQGCRDGCSPLAAVTAEGERS